MFSGDIYHHQDIGDTTQHTVNGELVSTSMDNILGGHDYYNHDGNATGHTEHNPQGGLDYIDNNGNLLMKTIPNGHGGHDTYDNHEQLISHTEHNVHGGNDVYVDGHLASSGIPMGHGYTSVMQYNDPLAHVGEYAMPGLDLHIPGI